MNLLSLLILALGLGLLGFIEPCSIGAHLLFLRALDLQSRQNQIFQALIFIFRRAVFIGAMGALAGLIGSMFFALQRSFWIGLGLAYVLLGILYLCKQQNLLLHPLGIALPTRLNAHRMIGLGLLFGLNVPACAAPLLAAVLGASVGAATISQGFLILMVFGGALSLPLLLAIAWPPVRAWLAWLSQWSARMPRWTGITFIIIGLWSIALALRG